jgi:hypothetical protein
MMLISIGEQRKGVGGAIFEALLNLVASIGGAILLGPIGVAWGTLIGALGGLLWTLIRVMPAVRDVRMDQGTFLNSAVLRGSIPCIPFAAFWLMAGHLTPMAYNVALAICVIAALSLGKRVSGLFDLNKLFKKQSRSPIP